MTSNKDGETTELKHAGSCADDDDDERCRCPECGLKFHREMARWFRERVWFWTGQAVKVFELHLQRIRAVSVMGGLKRRALGVNEGRKRRRFSEDL